MLLSTTLNPESGVKYLKKSIPLKLQILLSFQNFFFKYQCFILGIFLIALQI